MVLKRSWIETSYPRTAKSLCSGRFQSYLVNR